MSRFPGAALGLAAAILLAACGAAIAATPAGAADTSASAALATTATTTPTGEDAAGPAAAARFEVHHSLFPTTFLDADIAARHAIARAPDRTLLNISVRRHAGADDQPHPAAVTGTATDLMGLQRRLAFREVREPGAIYYLADLQHADQETWRFAIDVAPEGHDRVRVIKFTQTLWHGEERR